MLSEEVKLNYLLSTIWTDEQKDFSFNIIIIFYAIFQINSEICSMMYWKSHLKLILLHVWEQKSSRKSILYFWDKRFKYHVNYVKYDLNIKQLQYISIQFSQAYSIVRKHNITSHCAFYKNTRHKTMIIL